MTVEAIQGTMLLLADTLYPGWQATDYGVSAPIRRANAAFRAVGVPAGRRELMFEYRAVSVWVGVTITVAGIFGVVIMACGLGRSSTQL